MEDQLSQMNIIPSYYNDNNFSLSYLPENDGWYKLQVIDCDGIIMTNDYRLESVGNMCYIYVFLDNSVKHLIETIMPYGGSITTEYHNNGTLSSISTTDKNYEDDGIHTTWYPDGTMSSRTCYVKGNQHGSFMDWDPYGNILSDHSYKHGVMHGVQKNYWENRKVNILTYEEGVVQGEQLEYYDNGNISVKNCYKEGKKHGLCEMYHLNGEKMSTCTYVYGVEEGRYISWYDDGCVDNVTYYSDGKKHGVEAMFEQYNGDLIYYCTYKHGVKHGEEKENGSLNYYYDGIRYPQNIVLLQTIIRKNILANKILMIVKHEEFIKAWFSPLSKGGWLSKRDIEKFLDTM